MFDDFKQNWQLTWQAVQNLQQKGAKFQKNAQTLVKTLPQVEQYTKDVQRAVNLCQFKNEPRLLAIQKILDKYQK